jgi:hypothetical protein
MRIDKQGRCASFVRDGDCFIVHTGVGGTSFEYSPTSEPGAPVIGAFVASSTFLRYFTAVEAATLLDEHGVSAEEHLLTSAKVGEFREEMLLGAEKDPLDDFFKRLCALGASMKAGITYDGSLNEWYADIATLVSPGMPIKTARKLIRKLSQKGLGITVYGGASAQRVAIDWDMLSEHADPVVM